MVAKLGRKVIAGFAGAVILGVVAGFSLIGCSDGPVTTEKCVGGVVIDGKCEGKCDASKCLANNTCIANRCELQCQSDSDCIAGTQKCVLNKLNDDNAAVNVCEYTLKSTDINTPCPNGNECDALMACPDGKPCGDGVASPTCTADQCQPLHCIGSGLVGDATAYCSNVDCKMDSDCVPGMGCSVIRLTQNICNTKKGTDMPCLDPSDFNANGATFQEGPISLLRNVCRKNGPCSPCVNDDDCAAEPSQSCISLGAASVCAPACSIAKDCEADSTCTGGYCIPKTQACVGNGGFCEHCVTDLDCAAGGPTVACIVTSGSQHACFDTTAVNCTTDAGCPTSPSGKHGKCLDENAGLSAGDPGYHTCYIPFNASTNKYQCW